MDLEPIPPLALIETNSMRNVRVVVFFSFGMFGPEVILALGALGIASDVLSQESGPPKHIPRTFASLGTSNCGGEQLRLIGFGFGNL
jgi:hypothetical protein